MCLMIMVDKIIYNDTQQKTKVAVVAKKSQKTFIATYYGKLLQTIIMAQTF